MAISFASITRPFHAIGTRFCSQRRLKAVPTRIHGRSLTMRPIEAADAGLVGSLLMRLSEHACWLRYSRPRLAPAVGPRSLSECGHKSPGRPALVVLSSYFRRRLRIYSGQFCIHRFHYRLRRAIARLKMLSMPDSSSYQT
jgi:hypothetical protein